MKFQLRSNDQKNKTTAKLLLKSLATACVLTTYAQSSVVLTFTNNDDGPTPSGWTFTMSNTGGTPSLTHNGPNQDPQLSGTYESAETESFSVDIDGWSGGFSTDDFETSGLSQEQIRTNSDGAGVRSGSNGDIESGEAMVFTFDTSGLAADSILVISGITFSNSDAGFYRDNGDNVSSEQIGIGQILDLGTSPILVNNGDSFAVIAESSNTRVLTITFDLQLPPEPELISFFGISGSNPIEPGESATLEWTVDSSIDSITIDSGVGDVTGITVGGSGQFVVTPSETTIYTLTAVDTDTGDSETNAFLLEVASPTAEVDYKRPNIVLIMVDDMGWSDIGCYGAEILTPNLDTLATNGIRFRQFYNTSKCWSTRGSLLTGLYNQQAGGGKSALVKSVTFGEVLRTAGYHTYASGKHHNSQNLYDRGFDRYYGLRDGACNHFNPGLQRDGEPEPAHPTPNNKWCDDALTFSVGDPDYQHYFPEDFYSTDAFTDKALEYLDEWGAADSGRPFLLYLSYTAPHDPLHAWPEDIDKYNGVYDGGYDAIRTARYQKQQAIGLIDPNKIPLSPSDHGNWNSLSADGKAKQARIMQVYAAMVDRVDQRIGDVVQKLKDLGAYDDTLILFLSDNGANKSGSDSHPDDPLSTLGTVGRSTSYQKSWANVSNTPFRSYKLNSSEGGIRTPVIAHWPNGIVAPGRFSDKTGHVMDFMATFIELAGAEYPSVWNNEGVTPLQGESFTDVLYDQVTGPRAPIYFNYQSGRALIQDNYKLLSTDNGSNFKLYDMSTDASENNDISDTKTTLFNTMIADYNAWMPAVVGNLIPTANHDTLTSSIGAAADIDVLANDIDSDGSIDASTLRVTTPALYGSAVVTSANTIRYYPQNSAVSSDSIGYQVMDNDGALSNEGIATILFDGSGADSDMDGLPNSVEDTAGLDKNDPSDAEADLDGDGESNVVEYKLGTNLQDADSKIDLRIKPLSVTEFMIEWNATPGTNYTLRKTNNLNSAGTTVEMTAESKNARYWDSPADRQFYWLEFDE